MTSISSQDALRLIIGLWLATAVFATIREAQNPSNPGRPLPRPCVLLGSAAGFTVLAVGAELVPAVAAAVAVGVTVGALLAPAVAGRKSAIAVLDAAVQKLNAISGGAS